MESSIPESSGQANLAALFVEESMASILSSLMVPGEQLRITLKRRTRRDAIFVDAGSGALKTNSVESFKTYIWPGKTVVQTWRFTALLRILSLIYSAIQRNTVVTKRDIYYDDPLFFGSQAVVDKLIDDIAYTIGVDRSVLHVTATAKGLITGCFGCRTSAGMIYDPCSLEAEAVLLPRVEEMMSIDISTADWVLIVEKDAVFRRLLEQRVRVSSAVGKGIVITGKGYPDLNTRAFIHRICETARQTHAARNFPIRHMPKICALIDADPDGMTIMSVYKYGSLACAYDNARLNAPELSWLGVRISAAAARATSYAHQENPDTSKGDDRITNENSGDNSEPVLLPLTMRDRRKARSMMMKNPVFAENGPEQEWRRELQVMLMLNVKAEIEAFYESGRESFEAWINAELAKQSTWE